MNRIQKLFTEKNKSIVSIYFTAGYPKLNQTSEIIQELQNSGANLIEIGMPFSDPLADGPVIQESSSKAIENGMNLNLLFDQLENIRKEVSIPLILMGYLNPVYQYGIEKFLEKCKQVGIDGLIIPDLPVTEYEEEYKSLFDKHDILNIFLITPQTSDERIQKIDKISKGFIYMVSSSSTTGVKKGFSQEQIDYFKRIQNMKLQNPLLVGFGISDNSTYNEACKYANGVIIGSAFVKKLSKKGSIKELIRDFMKEILNS